MCFRWHYWHWKLCGSVFQKNSLKSSEGPNRQLLCLHQFVAHPLFIHCAALGHSIGMGCWWNDGVLGPETSTNSWIDTSACWKYPSVLVSKWCCGINRPNNNWMQCGVTKSGWCFYLCQLICSFLFSIVGNLNRIMNSRNIE